MSRVLWIAKIGLSLGLVAALLLLLDWRKALEHLSNLALGWTALAVLVNLAGLALSAWRWQALLAVIAPRVPFLVALRFYWIGAFFSSLLPSNVGGDVVRLALARHVGGTGPVAASMVVERATGLATVVALGIASAVAAPGLLADGRLSGATGIAGLLALGALALLAWKARALVARLPLPAAAGAIRKTSTAFLAALSSYRSKTWALAVTCGLSLLFNCLLALFQYFVIRAVGGNVDLLTALLVTPLIMMISALPLSVNGIGLSEGAFVVLYGHAGLDHEVALAAALLRRIVITLVAAFGGVLWALDRRSLPAGDPGSGHLEKQTAAGFSSSAEGRTHTG